MLIHLGKATNTVFSTSLLLRFSSGCTGSVIAVCKCCRYHRSLDWIKVTFTSYIGKMQYSRGLIFTYPIDGKCLKSAWLRTCRLNVALLRRLVVYILTRRSRRSSRLIRSRSIAGRSLSKCGGAVVTTNYWHHCILNCHGWNGGRFRVSHISV